MPETTMPAGADAESPLGVFDSGLGGLSILREIRRELPGEDVVYFGDTLHLPYGPRPLEEVRRFAVDIVGNLLALPVKLVVVACNAASAASLKYLREMHPGVPFVGMEPAVKPAAAETRTGRVGVLATKATFQGQLFESVVERFAKDTEVICHACPGLAVFIERHPPDHPDLEPMLEEFIRPLRERGIDRLVLACTHYPLVKDAIQRVAGPNILVVDPSPAIARRTHNLLRDMGILNPGRRGGGGERFFVSGDSEAFARSASMILGRAVQVERAAFSEPAFQPGS